VHGKKFISLHSIHKQYRTARIRVKLPRKEMEEDRAQVDLGVAVDIEERLKEPTIPRQPKKRFVGRRQAAEAASKNGPTSIEESGAIQGFYLHTSRKSA
jgi:hypothetical protein